MLLFMVLHGAHHNSNHGLHVEACMSDALLTTCLFASLKLCCISNGLPTDRLVSKNTRISWAAAILLVTVSSEHSQTVHITSPF